MPRYSTGRTVSSAIGGNIRRAPSRSVSAPTGIRPSEPTSTGTATSSACWKADSPSCSRRVEPSGRQQRPRPERQREADRRHRQHQPGAAAGRGGRTDRCAIRPPPVNSCPWSSSTSVSLADPRRRAPATARASFAARGLPAGPRSAHIVGPRPGLSGLKSLRRDPRRRRSSGRRAGPAQAEAQGDAHDDRRRRAVPDAQGGTDSPAVDALLRTGRFFARTETSPDLRAVYREGGRDGDVFYRDRWSHDKVVRSTHGVNCTGLLLVEGLRQGRDHHLGDPADRLPVGRAGLARSTSRAAARAARRSPGTPTPPPGCATRTPAACSSRCTARPRPGSATRCSAWAEVTTDPEKRRRYQQARGKGGLVRVVLGRGRRDRRRRARAHDQDLRPGPRRGLLPDPGDVDGVALRRHPVHPAHRRGDDVVLRLVRRPARGQPAGVRRPDRRAGVRRLVGRHLPDDVGLERPGHPHPGRALDGRGPLPGHEGRRGRPRTTPTTPSSPTSGCPPRPAPTAALAMAMGHVILKEFFVERRVPFFVDYVQRYTDLPFLVTLEPQRRRRARAGQVPHRGRPRRPTARGRGAGRRCCSTGAPASRSCRTGRWASATPTPASGRWNLDLDGVAAQLDPAGGGTARPPRCCCPASTRPTAPAACCAAGCRCAGSAGSWSPRSST